MVSWFLISSRQDAETDNASWFISSYTDTVTNANAESVFSNFQPDTGTVINQGVQSNAAHRLTEEVSHGIDLKQDLFEPQLVS